MHGLLAKMRQIFLIAIQTVHNFATWKYHWLKAKDVSHSRYALAYYAHFFTYFAFEQCSKKLPIMLNIMPITTEIIPQFIYDFPIFND